MKERMQKTLSQVNGCPQRDRSETEWYGGVQTFMWMCEDNIVEVPFDKEHLFEQILSPANLSRAYKAVMRNKGCRIRMCIWKAWKLPKTRMKNLVRCGINKYDARRWGYVKGYWRVSGSPIMHLAASSQKLHQAGYPTLMGSYLEWHPK